MIPGYFTRSQVKDVLELLQEGFETVEVF
jgi:hypothetical protein